MSYDNKEAWQSGIAILEDNVFERQTLSDAGQLAERRKDSRFNVTVPLSYRIQGAASTWNRVETQDVSNTGLRLQMQESPAIGTHLELDVVLPGQNKNIIIEGVVIWTRPSTENKTIFECGIAFKNLKKITGKEKLLKFITDKLCFFAIKNQPQNLMAYPAANFEELKPAFGLIYAEYLSRGYCPAHISSMYYSFYSVLPTSRIFLLKKDNHLLGTVTLIQDSPFSIPMEGVFPDLIGNLRKEGRVLAEVSLLALNRHAFNKKSFSLTDFQKLTGTFQLFKALFDYVRLKTPITDLVIAVHPKHEDLYQYLTFQKMGHSRPYATACGKPALPMRLAIESAGSSADVSLGLIRYFYDRPTPDELLSKKMDWTPELLEDLLTQKSEIWTNLPVEYKKLFKKAYPNFKPA